MARTIVGKDQLADEYRVTISNLDDENGFQNFTKEVLETNNVFISTLAMDFPSSTSSKERKAITEEWIERLPELDHIKKLDVRHRVNEDFFEAICQMKNLQSLNIWMATVENIESISKLTKLKSLGLSNFSRLTNVEPIVELKCLESLSLLASFKVSDYACLGKMNWLKSLMLGGDSTAPKNLMLPSLYPFANLKDLLSLDMSSASVRDRNYRPILELKALKRLDAHWRMKREEREFLQREHPSLRSGFFMAYDFVKNEFKEGVEWWVEKN